ncbi:MAG: caspase family protein, partial [Acidimicrobiia bacterium]|nr:caspase family protein [Acidimicrobiia bacterium]
ATDTQGPTTTIDVGPQDPTPLLQPRVSSGGGRYASSGGGGGDASVPTGHAVARAQPARAQPFANLAAPGATPKVWAVVIGIQQYQGRTHPTAGGEGDAAAFMQVLHNAHWPDDHILELVDGQATAGNIRNAMQWLTQHSAPDTLTLFHYSGHTCIQSSGPCGAGHTYLWSVDNQFISDDEVGNNLRNLQGKAWVDFAGCEADSFDKGISNGQRLVTASSQANQKSYESYDWHESVWVGLAIDQGMLQGKADTNHDGVVTVQEAAQWAKPQASQMTQGQPNGNQDPVISSGLDFNLAAAAAPPPPPQQSPNNGGGGNGNGNPPPPSNSPSPGCNSLTKSVLHC